MIGSCIPGILAVELWAVGLEAGGYVIRHSAERLEADSQGRRPETGKERFESWKVERVERV